MNDLFTTSGVVSSDRVLYTASSFARSSLLHLQEIGELKARKPHTSERSGLQSYLFFVVIDGTGTLTYDGKTYSLTTGDCIFIDCRKPYSHTTDESNLWSLRWCHFYGLSMQSIYNKYCERGGRPCFSIPSLEPINLVWSRLMETAKGSDYMRDMIINEELSKLLTLIMEQSWHPEDKALPSKRASVMEVKKYLDENYAEHITLDHLCTRFFISKYYLTHSFKEQFGVPITTYLTNVRITHAKQLLRFSNKTVEEIGVETGIGEPAYFSRVFKAVEGMPPSTYRDQW